MKQHNYSQPPSQSLKWTILEKRFAQTLVVIDPSVKNHHTFIQDLQHQPHTIVYTLDPNQDGIKQITDLIQRIGFINSLHIVSHGAPGYLLLGNTSFSLGTITHYAPAISQWFTTATSPSVTLYGCNVAAGDAGEEFLHKLHILTQARIAASVTPVGHPRLGGNWTLEYTTDGFDPQVLFSKTFQQTYSGILTTPITDITATYQIPLTPPVAVTSTPAIGADNPPFAPGTTFTTNFSQGTGAAAGAGDLILSGFTLAGQTFAPRAAGTQLILRRNDNALFNDGVVGDAIHAQIHTPFFDSTFDQNPFEAAIAAGNTTLSVDTSIALTNEEALNGSIINRGAETIFFNANSGNTRGTSGNVERLDYLFGTGPVAIDATLGTNNNLTQTGFLLLERGGNDPFKIAAVTSVDANGLPATFGTLVEVANNNWGVTNFSVSSFQMRRENGSDLLQPANHFGEQQIGATFVSWADLGVALGQNIFGYALFDTNTTLADPDGADGNTDLADWTNTAFYPQANASSLDLLAGGLLFTTPDVPLIPPIPPIAPPPPPVVPVVPPTTPGDRDNDGIPDIIDIDKDNDGIPDVIEDNINAVCEDDTIPSSLDLDSDNDGILDITEAGHGQIDVNGDGRVDGPVGANGLLDALETSPDSGIINYAVFNTDGDLLFNFQDLDSDNDSITDVTESNGSDPDFDGYIGTTPVTVNADGVATTVDPAVGGTPTVPPDTDSDLLPDYLDLDSDNDGLFDVLERSGSENAAIIDPDENGMVEGVDSEPDGITDLVDGAVGTCGTGPSTNLAPLDANGDGVPDYREITNSIVGAERLPGPTILLGFSDTDALIGNNDDNIINGGSNADTIRGGGGDDVVNGGTGDDNIRGGAGDDVINGGTGDDTIAGNRGDDLLNGGRGDDTIRGGGGRDQIFGGGGSDRLFGNGGVDTIEGGRGNDRINGGNRRDIIQTGEGRDVVVISSVDGMGDVVTDFSIILDTIALSQLNGGVTSFSALRIEQNNNDALVKNREGQLIVRLSDTEAADLDSSHFTF